MRPLPESAIFDRDALRRLGWSDSAISRAARSRRLTPVRYGRFTVPGPVDARIAALAAVGGIAGAVISHRSALVMLGLPSSVGDRRLPS
jgi:hypothetical protein